MRRRKPHKYSPVLATLLAGASAVALTPAGAAAASGAAELKLTASDDTYASSGRKAATFGSEDKLVAGVLDRDVKTTYLKFTVPAGVAVSAARLRLNIIGEPSGEVSVRRLLDDGWTEDKLTSANAPALGPVLATVTPKPSDTTLVLGLNGAVTGAGSYSFALTSTGDAVRFRSSESARGGPELDLTPAGEAPATAPPAAATPAPASGGPNPTNPVSAPTTGPAGGSGGGSVGGSAGGSHGGSGGGSAGPTTPAGGDKDCVTGELLVPSCGVLWGAAAGGFTTAPRDQELLTWEKVSGRTATIFHTYHKGDEPFPTKSEIAMTADAAHPRVLLMNWKIAYGSSWAKVARGDQDARIDAFAERAKAYGKKFFLVLNHEPENDVIARAGSGMEAADFAAMYRHTILRLRAKGVTNVVNVVALMGNEKWMAQSWWKDLYPGDDVVDWMGLDSYVSAEPGYYHYGTFDDLLDRAPTGGGMGFYEWATTKHPGKPLMVAEWGAYHRIGHPADKAPAFASVRPELAKRPAVKAIVYFDTKHDDTGDRDISINSSASALAAFKKLAADPIFDVKLAG
ncbi:MAG TPA: DNRLRE domain-containing protein [Actinoplanes sp.]|jgi:beta-mannanase